jgi:hypothetical protein
MESQEREDASDIDDIEVEAENRGALILVTV